MTASPGDIEHAPRDGTEIKLLSPTDACVGSWRQRRIGFWVIRGNKKGHRRHEERLVEGWFCRGGRQIDPTHWEPLGA